jgi:threonylcarbamoyladenosine tRNA methylthiotransferase MtaB
MYSIAIYTFGCKLNQFESESIADAFAQAGFPVAPWKNARAADIIIINTCTVTSKADQKARRLIRKTLREHPQSCVIVTGCYAQLDSPEIEALETESRLESCVLAGEGRRLFVLKGGEPGVGAMKSALLELPRYLAKCPAGGIPGDLIAAWGEKRPPGMTDTFGFTPEYFSFHSRAYLKIQDGCDSHCAYCRVRLARGPSVSLAASRALAELLALQEKGYAEVMITGVNITQYRDTGVCNDFAELLEYLLAGSTKIALRLSSMEPEGIREKLANVLTHPRIRPHFHLSVQSGSLSILQKMGRGYTPEFVGQAADLLRKARNDPFLACDIITGFPGETMAEFEKTLFLCRQIDFAWIHAFPYSKRPGTPAFSFGDAVCERDAVQRVETLLDLARQRRQAYIRRWTGHSVQALVERGNTEKDGCCRALSENYLKLVVRYRGSHAPRPGTVLRCRISESILAADGEGSDAEAVEL